MIIEDIVGHLPWTAGRIVGICQFRDHALLACENRVYRLTYDFMMDGVHVEAVARVPPMPEPI
jgi:hypothetical protein